MSSGGPPPSGHRLSGRLSHLQSRLRSGSRHGMPSKVLKSGSMLHGGASGWGASQTCLAGVQGVSHGGGYNPPPLRAPPANRLGASAGVGQEASCRVDAATMRRIRREYAETISLKTSQGQPGLIRLVLQSSAGGPLPGGPPASPVERVVVCVRRPIVKGSTYLVFFEASRAAPEAAEPPPLATAAAPARATAFQSPPDSGFSFAPPLPPRVAVCES
ncbi:hypothetical protein cyc_09184 [Cyclospora cayetanensis]|uniref:Uncharacterized protein n=1 Tax=Cyclospora cayetanensis TaxID=88456 RepID=A0A1D3D6G9_9EIME|nr:hypothetical protein cyc_09184 [Cyclospora cayetanensis]